MSLQIRLVTVAISLKTRCLFDEIKDARNVSVEVSLFQFAALYAVDYRIELLLFARLEHIIARPYLLGSVLTSKPIGHYCAFVAPFFAQDCGQKFLAFRSIYAIDFVVSRHDSPRFGVFYGYFERLQIELTNGTLRDTGVCIHAVSLLVIERKVLDTRANTVALNAPNVGCCGLTSH